MGVTSSQLVKMSEMDDFVLEEMIILIMRERVEIQN